MDIRNRQINKLQISKTSRDGVGNINGLHVFKTDLVFECLLLQGTQLHRINQRSKLSKIDKILKVAVIFANNVASSVQLHF